jgi:tetratricopeptide (TPR) repeat protein
MTKDKIIFGVIGLAIGLVVGFLFANNVNRTSTLSNDTSGSNVASGSNTFLPPDHPPIGQTDSGAEGRALPEVTAAIEKARNAPQDFEAQMTAGDLYYQIQRLDEAIEFYEKANQLRPDDNEPLIKLGNTYFDAKRYEDAERTYAAVLKRTPNDVNVRTDLGLTFFLRNPRDLDRAIKEYVAALAIEPEHEITLQNLAVAYKEKGDVQNLRQTMDRLGRVNPSNPFLAQNGQ